MKFYKLEDIWFIHNEKTKDFLLADPNQNAIMNLFSIDMFLKKLSVKNTKDWSWRCSYQLNQQKLNAFLKKYK